MIPLRLKIAGFLSYREPSELDFTGFDLACISGPNGAGKSTLLDAMTWALFGQARRRDDALINLQSDTAEVSFAFRYENADYRVLRSLRRGKPGSLELQVRPIADGPIPQDPEESWKPLTERSLRETQTRIEGILRLDYETFINASFFLQGKADLFAQQTPAKRKEVLSSIMGMEIWEAYKTRTAERRHRSESEMTAVLARIGEVESELAEAPQRRARLTDLEAELSRLRTSRTAQTSALNSLRKTQALLEKQRALLSEQTVALDGLRRDVDNLALRLRDRQVAQRESTRLTENAVQIEANYAAWRQSRTDLEHWESIARAFRDHEHKRAPMLQQIAAERARLEQENAQLEARRTLIEEARAAVISLGSQLSDAEAALAVIETQIQERAAVQTQLAEAREDLAGKAAENKNLKEKMDDLKQRIETLDAATGAACPLCGQELTREHRLSTVRKLETEGRELGDRYRANMAQMQVLRESTEAMQGRVASRAGTDDARVVHAGTVAALSERLGALHRDINEWDTAEQGRLAENTEVLATEAFAAPARRKLAKVDAELAALGYDAAAHDDARRQEASLREGEQAYAQLQTARGALEPLDNEIRSIEAQILERQQALERSSAQFAGAQAEFDALAMQAPDLAEAERQLFDLQEQENRLNQEVGAARQKVNVLGDLEVRSAELQTTRQALAITIGRHKSLEAAFGKDGVPALLIEQALPEVEAHANDILDRLSDGSMSVHFETQTAYRDRKRDDLRETLDIRISDGAGQRAYEMYSGGEAFRVNFAIRLALSQVLAARTGARLQTLVIDEGFGSQDAQGIQRLIETINVIRPDFAKILLISHLDELKEAFPTRIEVEKNEHGSVLTVN